MKKLLLVFFLISLAIQLKAEPIIPYAMNALSSNGTMDEKGYGVAIDSDVNAYFAGEFYGTVNFGETELVSNGSSDIYVVKTDSSGNFIWAIKAGGLNVDTPNKIYVDDNDNFYLIGTFFGTAYFENDSVVSNGSQDVFVAKYNSNGELQFVINVGSNDADYGKDIAIDSNGNFYIAGVYQSTIDFGNSVTLTADGFQESFIASYDNTGVCQWASRIEGNIFDFSSCNGIELLNSNIIVSGVFVGKADFGNSIVLNSNSNNDLFVAEYDNTGTCQWANQFSSTSSSDAAYNYDLETDDASNIYISGFYKGSLVVSPDITLTSNGNEDMFVIKLDGNGDPLWGYGFGGTGYDNCTAMTFNDNLYIGGTFNNTVQFSFESSVTSVGGSDIFTAVITAAGEVKGAYSAGSTGADIIFSMVSDDNSLGFITGTFENDLDLGNNVDLTNTGNDDAFFAKFNLLPVVISTIDYNLHDGWNYISANVMPEEVSLDSIFKDIIDNIVIVMDNHNNIYLPSLGINTIGDFNNSDVYSVYVSASSTFSITGEEVKSEEYTLSLDQGWNFLPYLNNTELPVATVLNSILNDIVIVMDSNGNVFVPNSFDTIGNMKMGEGYKVYLKNSTNFTYPQN